MTVEGAAPPWGPARGVGAGRYAPSPTGALHLGNLRTAVVAWLFARSTGRRFLFRVEDLDPLRSRPGVAAQQYADLLALGLDFDGVAVVQSERGAAYTAALERLAGRTYECFCTRREIAEATAAPHGEEPGYPGTCRDLTEAERAVRRSTRAPAVRLRADGARMSITDLVHGEVTGRVDDIVLRRNDGVPSYHLAVVVDDAESGVDQVVRGADLLPAAVSQAYLTELLGHPAPAYAHVQLALNPGGARLAKRDGAVSLAQLAEIGHGPREVLGMIALSLGLDPPRRMADLLAEFDPTRLPREAWVVRAENLAPARPRPAVSRGS